MYNKIDFKDKLDTLFNCAHGNCKGCLYRYNDNCTELIANSVASYLVSATVFDTDGDLKCPVIIL